MENEAVYPHVYTHVVTRCDKVECWCKSQADAEATAAAIRAEEDRRYRELLGVYLYGRRERRQEPDEQARHAFESKRQKILLDYPTERELGAAIRRAQDRVRRIEVRALTIKT